MSDSVFYRRRCDGRLRNPHSRTSYRCTKRVMATSPAELEVKSQHLNWRKIDEEDICPKCAKDPRRQKREVVPEGFEEL